MTTCILNNLLGAVMFL